MNAKSLSKVWYLRSVAPLPCDKVYSQTLIHVFHLYGICARKLVSNHRSRNRGVKTLQTASKFRTGQVETDPEEPEGRSPPLFVWKQAL